MTKATEMNTAFLRRARKLLALSKDDGATEAEAANAAAKLQDLLQELNLTLVELETSGEAADQGSREKRTSDRRAMYEYQKQLMAALAENNFCLHKVVKFFVQEKGGRTRKWVNGELVEGWLENRHLLVGRQLNVQVTVDTYDYLVETMKRLNPYDVRYADGKRFFEGAVSRLSERLAERRREREKDSTAQKAAGNGTHRELVLSDVYGSEADLNNDTLNGFPPGTTAANRRKADEREIERQAMRERLVAEGVDEYVAWYRSYGYDEERAVRAAADFRRSSGRSGRGRGRSWTRGDEEHSRKINSQAYKAGRVAAANIGLDSQVGAASRKRIGG